MSKDELQGYSMIADFITKLRDKGSWCGETHVQKTSYLAQELLGVPFGFNFILYRHGAYSFDLHEEIGTMRAYKFLDIEIPPPPYGPSLALTERGEELTKRFRDFTDKFAEKTDWIAARFGNKTVVELERLTTAFYVTRENGMEQKDVDDRAQRLNKLKPHISIAEAKDALKSIDATIREASNAADEA